MNGKRGFTFGRGIQIILLVSGCINLVLLGYIGFLLQQSQEGSPVGTYCTGDGRSPQDQYLVFQRDNFYTLYRQFEVLDVGTYTTEDSGVLSLQPEEDGGKRFAVFSDWDTVCLVDSENEILVFYKLTSHPTYINVDTSVEFS